MHLRQSLGGVLGYFGIRNDRYSPSNERHQQLVRKQTAELRAAFVELFKVDLKIASIHSGLFFLAGLSITYQGIAHLVAYSLLTSRYDRGKYSEQFQRELRKAHEMYDWCAANGARVSFDPVFQAFFESIALFLPEKYLHKWNSDEVSPVYEKILNAKLRLQDQPADAGLAYTWGEVQLEAHYNWLAGAVKQLPMISSMSNTIAAQIGWFYEEKNNEQQADFQQQLSYS